MSLKYKQLIYMLYNFKGAWTTIISTTSHCTFTVAAFDSLQTKNLFSYT